MLVTGSAGRVGQVLLAALSHAQPYDLPQDVLDPAALASSLEPGSQVIHLAWRRATENYNNGGKDPVNLSMTERVLDAAFAAGTSRVLLASSVHAGALVRNGCRLVRPDDPRPPVTPYGSSKRTVERLGRQASERGLDVVSVRFGGVGPAPDSRPSERGLWLSPEDCVAAVRAVLAAPVEPGRNHVFYAVSRTRWRQHSTVNDVGWAPVRSWRRS